MFALFLERQHVALGARRADVLGTLVGEAAVGEEGTIGRRTAPGDAKPVLDGTREVGHGPALAVEGGRRETEELPGSVLVEGGPDGFTLLRGELGAVAAEAAIDQGGHAAGAVAATLA